ncbi:MAG: type II CAAX endopeptidase family protein [Candidatus Krumholzibacteriia bacterium]
MRFEPPGERLSAPMQADTRGAIATSAPPVTTARRVSLWMMAAAMVLVVGLKSVPDPGPVAWHWPGFALAAAALVVGRRDADRNWFRILVLLAYTIVVLWFTRIDGDTGNAHVLELTVTLGVGILVVPALAARWWLGEPLDYSWMSGRWSLKMWLWLPAALALAYGILWLYFHELTPDLHLNWPLPPPDHPRQEEALWRLFWGCNLVGLWDELAFINFVFVLLDRRFGSWEANCAQAVFFTSFLHEMAFVGWGPVFVYAFALTQGYTYRRTRSLLYIVILHLMVDTVLFSMIASRWYPGWGWSWHP